MIELICIKRWKPSPNRTDYILDDNSGDIYWSEWKDVPFVEEK